MNFTVLHSPNNYINFTRYKALPVIIISCLVISSVADRKTSLFYEKLFFYPKLNISNILSFYLYPKYFQLPCFIFKTKNLKNTVKCK